MRCRVAYHCGQPPTPWTRMTRGTLVIEGDRVDVDGPVPVRLHVSDIRSLSFRREFGLFHIALESEQPVFITPVLFSVGGYVQLLGEGRNIKVYTALHKLLGGPGCCAKCHADVTDASRPCARCGSERVKPMLSPQAQEEQAAAAGSRLMSRTGRAVAFVLAALGTVHFAPSIVLWALAIYAALRLKAEIGSQLYSAAGAALLLTCFAAATIAAMRRRRLCVALLALGLCASAALFAYDAGTRNWQMHTEDYHATGHQKTFHYFTWWWYDESWFYRHRRKAPSE